MNKIKSLFNLTPPPPQSHLIQQYGNSLIVVVLIVIAQLFLFFYIPHGQSPDEFSHITRATSLAHGNFILKADSKTNQIAGEYVNKNLLEYYNKLSKIPFHYEEKYTKALKEDIRKIRFNDEYVYKSVAGAAVYFPLSYLPQAIAIFAGEKLHLRVSGVISAARILNLIAIISLILIAARLWALPLLAGIVLLMPMCLFQMTTVSSDGLHFAMVVLIVCLFLNILNKFSKAKFLWLCFFI